MRLLIVGGAGFGGASLANAAIDVGHDIAILDPIAPANAYRLNPIKNKIKYIWKAVQDVTSDDIRGFDIVAHFGAQADVPLGISSPRSTAYQNIDGTIQLLEAVRGLGVSSYPAKVMFASSGSVYGRPAKLPILESDPLTPHNPYSASKASAELYCFAYHRAFAIPSVVITTGVVIGPGMRPEVFVRKWLHNIALRHPITLEGGEQTRDITYIDDAVSGWIAAISGPPENVVGQKFHITYGEELSVEKIMDICLSVGGGADLYVDRVPARPGDAGQREQLSSDKAAELLGFRAKTNPVEAIRLTWEWVKSELQIDESQRRHKNATKNNYVSIP